MDLNNQQKKRLKALAHTLKPVVTIGQHGMKPSIDDELEVALNFHQLIKVKIGVGDRLARDNIIADIEKSHKATLIQRIGNMAILFRRNFEKANLLN